MRAKILVGTALLMAFLTGAIFEGYLEPQLNKASTSPDDTVRVFLTSKAAYGVSQPRVVYRDVLVVRGHQRSRDREMLIVAGSAGAAIGVLAGGKKGAGIGALSGGLAGLAYDLATRKR